MTKYNTCEAGEIVSEDGPCPRCVRYSNQSCGFKPADPNINRIFALQVHVRVLCRAIDSLVDFGTSVGGSSSYWDDVWPEIDAEIQKTREQL